MILSMVNKAFDWAPHCCMGEAACMAGSKAGMLGSALLYPTR